MSDLIRTCQVGDKNRAEILLLNYNSDGLSEKMVKDLNEILKELGIKPNKFNPKTKKIKLIREKIKEFNFEDEDFSPDFQDGDGWTALMHASHHGHINCVKVLLEYGASPGVRNNEGKTAFDIAEIDEIRDTIGGPLLILACKEGDEDETEKLFPYGIDFNVRNKHGRAALILASENGHENIVELLIQHDVNINHQNRDGYTPLILASENGHENIVELLLQHDADVNLYVKNPVRRRCFGREEIINYKFKTALMFACKNDHEKCVELLLQHGADPNLQDENGQTLLIWASEKGRENIVQILLQSNPEIELMDDKYLTALMAACSKGYDKCTEILLKRGANPNVEDGDEYTALMRASINNREKCVELLLQYEANPDVRHRPCNSGFDDYYYYDPDHEYDYDYGDGYGYTALMFACEEGHENIVEILLGYGADPDVKNNRDWTAFDLAKTDKIRDTILRGGLPGPKGAIKN